MSKTILHITEQLGIGGTEVLLKRSIPLLKEYQHVICYLGGADELRPAFADYLVYCLKHVRFRGSTHILYNFIPNDFLAGNEMQKHFSSPGTLNCVAVGNLKAVKNYSYIMAAFTYLQELPVSLAVYGQGAEKEQLQRTIDKGKMAIQLKGTTDNLQEVLPGYDLFLQMSLYEGFGLALVEAMARGLVPVLSDIPVHREVAGDCAFYVSLTSPKELSDMLKMILNNKEEYLRRKDECRQRAKEITSKEKYQEGLRDIYDRLLKQV